MKILRFTVLLAAIGLTGCQPPSSVFSLPEGDEARGEQIFVQMQCLACHTMEGYERPGAGEDFEISIALGGKVGKIKTYADLVTSVINPSHTLAKGYASSIVQQDGESVMPVYNDVMTVTQLVDLVTFLESKYEIRPYSRSDYGPIYDER